MERLSANFRLFIDTMLHKTACVHKQVYIDMEWPQWEWLMGVVGVVRHLR